MPSQQRAAYRIVLRGPKGFAKIRYATTFEIFYGKRRVLARRPFPVIFKKVSDKKQLLEQLIVGIETKRIRLLAKRRAKRKREKEIQRRADREKKLGKVLRRMPRKFENQFYRGFFFSTLDAEVSAPVFNKAYGVKPATAMKTQVIDTMIVPVEPEKNYFSKQIFDKEMRNAAWGDYHIATLDFSLKEDFYVPMTGENFLEAYQRSTELMLPHAIRYFQETMKSSSYYILRIKFLNNWDPDAPYENWGLSEVRVELRDKRGLINLFRETFKKFFGDGFDCANYLEGEKLVFVTGFTLEAMDPIKKLKF